MQAYTYKLRNDKEEKMIFEIPKVDLLIYKSYIIGEDRNTQKCREDDLEARVNHFVEIVSINYGPFCIISILLPNNKQLKTVIDKTINIMSPRVEVH